MKDYAVYEGISFDTRTPDTLRKALRSLIGRHVRVRVHYGNPETGRAYGDVETGYIGNSMGPTKIPLIINNTRSLGGPSLMDGIVVKVEYANKKHGGTIWEHPSFTPYRKGAAV